MENLPHILHELSDSLYVLKSVFLLRVSSDYFEIVLPVIYINAF